MLLDSANQSLPSPENAAAPQPITTLEPRIVEVRRRGSEVTDELFQLDSLNKKISIADLLIMQSSFDSKCKKTVTCNIPSDLCKISYE